MSKLMRNVLLLAKIEVTPGVDPVPAAATNSILCRVTNPQPVVAQFADRNIIRPFFGNAGKVQVSNYSQMEIEVELASSGAAGTAPGWGPLLQACAFSETVDVGDVTYEPVTSGAKTITLYYYLDGLMHKMTNARGNVTFTLNPGGIPTMQFTFTGFYNTVTDTALPAGADYSAFEAPFAVNKVNTPTFTIHGTSAPAEAFTINMNNQVTYRNLIGAEDVVMTDRTPSGNATIEMTSVASKAWHESVRLGTLGALQMIHGVGAGNIVQFDAPKVQLTEPSYSESDGIAMLSLGLQFQPDVGNDELVITVK